MDWCSIAAGIATGLLIAQSGSIHNLRRKIEELRDEVAAMRKEHARPIVCERNGR